MKTYKVFCYVEAENADDAIQEALVNNNDNPFEVEEVKEKKRKPKSKIK